MRTVICTSLYGPSLPVLDTAACFVPFEKVVPLNVEHDEPGFYPGSKYYLSGFPAFFIGRHRNKFCFSVFPSFIFWSFEAIYFENISLPVNMSRSLPISTIGVDSFLNLTNLLLKTKQTATWWGKKLCEKVRYRGNCATYGGQTSVYRENLQMWNVTLYI